MRASELKFRSMIEQSSDGIVLTDQDGNITEWNPAAERMLGVKRKETLGRPIWEIQYRLAVEEQKTLASYQQIKQHLDRFQDNLTPEYHLQDTEFMRPDGTRGWIQALVFPIQTQEGLVIGSFLRDITPQKEIEAQLRESEQQLSTLLNSIPTGVILIDAETKRVVDANPAAVEIFGGSKAQMVGLPCDQLFYPQSGDCAVVHPGTTRYSEIELIKADGQRIPILKTAAPVIVNGHQHLVESVSDISDYKQAEKALLELNATLESKVDERTAEIIEEKEKSEIILRSVADAIGMADIDLRIRYVNEAFTKLTGYESDEILGRPMHTVIGSWLSQGALQEMRHVLARGDQWQGEVMVKRKDGRTYEAAITITPMRDVSGELIGYVASHQDIGAAKDLVRAQAGFLTNISHQLRTPVANLKLYAHMLQQDIGEEKQQQYLQTLSHQVERLAHLVQDILTITDLDSGQAALTWQPIILSSLIGDTMTRYHDRALSAGITLKEDPMPENLPSINGDQSRLSQALNELVDNALTFTPPGGQITIRLAVAMQDNRQWVIIGVQDSGAGIPPEEKEQVFERFFRGESAESGHVPGTGLGLSMVHQIMQAHGGRVSVKSQVGQGSTFTLWLPATAPSAVA